MQKMQNQGRQEDNTPSHSLTTPEILSPTEKDRASPLPTQASSVTAPAAGGVKKKKPKKKK